MAPLLLAFTSPPDDTPPMFPPSGGRRSDGWFETEIRVQYPQCDPQGVVHHAVYLHYFEFGRTEMLRSLGLPYASLEAQGTQLVVVESRLRHRAAARYDEVLRVRTRVAGTTRVRIYLEYRILRGGSDEVVCEGEMQLAGTDRAGRPRALPDELRSLLPR
jgi:acyl-CoA thioester hydrolase